MDPLTLIGLSLVIFSLVAKWYIAPALDKQQLEAALVPLFLVHTLRYLPSKDLRQDSLIPQIKAVGSLF